MTSSNDCCISKTTINLGLQFIANKKSLFMSNLVCSDKDKFSIRTKKSPNFQLVSLSGSRLTVTIVKNRVRVINLPVYPAAYKTQQICRRRAFAF